MSIFEGFLSTSETLAAFSDGNFVDAMLRFEAALARAQAAEGLIPEAAAQTIVGSCKVELFDVANFAFLMFLALRNQGHADWRNTPGETPNHDIPIT